MAERVREPYSLQNFLLQNSLFQVNPKYNRCRRGPSLRSGLETRIIVTIGFSRSARDFRKMDNKAIANIFYETADLMKVASADPFRIRSYERAAEALEGWPQQVSEIYQDEKALLAIPGIGKGMAANIRELMTSGKLPQHEEMLQKFRPEMLQLLKISGLGPKTIALIWDAFKVCDVEGVAKLASEGKLRELPRLSEKSEQKMLKSIESYRQLPGRFLLDIADGSAT